MKSFLWLFCLLFLVSGCASKRYTKKASKFEDAGLYKDASEYYYEAVKRKDSNVEAKLGLLKNGQITLDQKVSVFLDYYKQGDFKQAMYKYLDADAYYEKIKAVNVELNFPNEYDAYFEESKNNYLSSKYIEGIEFLNREDFSSALAVFTEIKNVDIEYKDVYEKYIIAKYEPKYRQAIVLLENDKYRQAYYTFDYILNNVNEYKQAQAYKEEAKERGTLGILVTGFSATEKQNLNGSRYITSVIQAKLGELNNPFIKLIDPLTLNASIYKNRKVVDMQAANLAGIHLILSGQLLEYVAIDNKLKKTPQKGYIKEIIKLKDEEGVESESIKYHKAEYMEYEANSNSSLNLNYKVTSTTNSEVIISKNFSQTRTDEIHYAIFSGEDATLVPGNWKYKDRKSAEDVVKDNKKDVRELQGLLDARQKLKSASEMLDDLVKQSAEIIVNKIDNYNPEEK
jgi:hypothetical protein